VAEKGRSMLRPYKENTTRRQPSSSDRAAGKTSPLKG